MSPADTTDIDQRRRLAAAVRARRLELGISVRAAATQTAIARDTWIGLEEATRRTAKTAYATIERTLQWAPGSIYAILDGGDAQPLSPTASATGESSTALATSPAPEPPHPADTALIRVMRNPDLTDQQKARIIRAVIAEQQRFADQRAEELIRQVLEQ
ncbi:hypothetical protein [Actinoplanes sp. URMC 104]|uniref:hypothetical protein n=1 Tax=Actinoplanes sp. URMC 104 TaxID=3423409 RepID=UPI003F1D05B7